MSLDKDIIREGIDAELWRLRSVEVDLQRAQEENVQLAQALEVSQNRLKLVLQSRERLETNIKLYTDTIDKRDSAIAKLSHRVDELVDQVHRQQVRLQAYEFVDSQIWLPPRKPQPISASKDFDLVKDFNFVDNLLVKENNPCSFSAPVLMPPGPQPPKDSFSTLLRANYSDLVKEMQPWTSASAGPLKSDDLATWDREFNSRFPKP